MDEGQGIIIESNSYIESLQFIKSSYSVCAFIPVRAWEIRLLTNAESTVSPVINNR